MKELAQFILKNIVPEGKYQVSESEEDGKVNIEIKASSDIIGLIIGKSGNTIKALQTLLRVRGRIENKLVNINVSEE